MNSLEYLDLLIGEALERLVEASTEAKNNNEIDKRSFLMKFGRIVSELWSLRDEIYNINPSLKRDFVVEHEKDKTRFNELEKLHKEAFKMEKNNEQSSARELYQNLYDASHFGYFRLLAEAGLYRNSPGIEKKKRGQSNSIAGQ